jgi:hypothetical protein
VELLLPRSVRNRKKYTWSKKYPLSLEIQDHKTKQTVKLTLFVRNCKEKEEWFWKLKELTNAVIKPLPSPLVIAKVDEPETKACSSPTTSSNPLTPITKADIISQEISHLPRAQSLDLGSIASVHSAATISYPSSPSTPSKELSILSKELNYDQFMKSVMNYKPVNSNANLGWFNAFIGRTCYDILNEPFWSNWVAAKIQRKLKKLRLPYFMEALVITEIDLGGNLPKFNYVPKPPMVDARGLWIDFEINYSGNSN